MTRERARETMHERPDLLCDTLNHVHNYVCQLQTFTRVARTQWISMMALLPIYPLQVYGKHRSSTNIKERWLAHCLEVMLMRNKELHVAFIDAIPNKGGSASVMVKGTAQVGASALAPNTRVQEMYRIRLPHNPYTDRGVVIGEGKPENQNHACIFAFGEAMQAVDMNQDGCLAEAFKMRNLLMVGGQTGAGATGVDGQNGMLKQ